MAATQVIDHSHDHDSKFVEIVAILGVAGIFSTSAVVARVYTRACILRSFGFDDAVMAAAQILTIGTAIAIGIETQHGLGHHQWTIGEDDIVPYLKSFYSSIVIYNVAVCMVKISILLQYRRIFNSRLMQLFTLVGVIFMSCWAVTLSFLLSLVCFPVAAFWDKTVPGRCLDFLVIWYVIAAVNILSDIAIFSTPLPIIKSLQLPRRQKYLLMGVFALGFCTCAISIIRIRTLAIAAQTKDPSWDNVDAATWSFLELCIGVLAACLPTLRPLYVKVIPRLFGASTKGTSSLHTYGMDYPRDDSSGWKRTKLSSLKNGTILPDSDSTEGLHYGYGGAGDAGDAEIGLRDRNARPGDLSDSYRVFVMSAGSNNVDETLHISKTEKPLPLEPVSKGGILATTMITQRVD